jgi:sugar phosphate isomerase/epimerase
MPAVTATSSIAYAHYTLYEALPRQAARGFTRVEIGSFHSYCYHFNNGSPRPAELKTMLDDCGLTPVALNWNAGIGRSNEDPAIAEWIDGYKAKIEDAQGVGIPMMTMHFGRHHAGSDLSEERKRATDAYAQLAEYASQQGMVMLLELPHMHLVHHDCNSVITLLEQLDFDNVGLLIDSSHWGVIGYDLDEFLSRVGHRLRHVHLRDSVPRSTAELDRKFKRPALSPNPVYNLTLTPGLGVVDFAHFGQALDQIGYQGDVTTEFEYFDMPLDEIERQYDAGLSHLKKSGWSLADGSAA